MTDNDIKKSIEWHLNSETNCDEYSYKDFKERNGNCVGKMLKDALDLIDRQQAEIERYKGVIKLLENDVASAKSEAIKEFERKIKAHAYYIDVPKEHRVVDEDDIDAILKEMTEGSE